MIKVRMRRENRYIKMKVKETENATWYTQRKEYVKMASIKKDKIGMLWCHSHIVLRLIEVEVKVSGMSLTSF